MHGPNAGPDVTLEITLSDAQVTKVSLLKGGFTGTTDHMALFGWEWGMFTGILSFHMRQRRVSNLDWQVRFQDLDNDNSGLHCIFFSLFLCRLQAALNSWLVQFASKITVFFLIVRIRQHTHCYLHILGLGRYRCFFLVRCMKLAFFVHFRCPRTCILLPYQQVSWSLHNKYIMELYVYVCPCMCIVVTTHILVAMNFLTLQLKGNTKALTTSVGDIYTESGASFLIGEIAIPTDPPLHCINLRTATYGMLSQRTK